MDLPGACVAITDVGCLRPLQWLGWAGLMELKAEADENCGRARA